MRIQQNNFKLITRHSRYSIYLRSVLLSDVISKSRKAKPSTPTSVKIQKLFHFTRIYAKNFSIKLLVITNIKLYSIWKFKKFVSKWKNSYIDLSSQWFEVNSWQKAFSSSTDERANKNVWFSTHVPLIKVVQFKILKYYNIISESSENDQKIFGIEISKIISANTKIKFRGLATSAINSFVQRRLLLHTKINNLRPIFRYRTDE